MDAHLVPISQKLAGLTKLIEMMTENLQSKLAQRQVLRLKRQQWEDRPQTPFDYALRG